MTYPQWKEKAARLYREVFNRDLDRWVGESAQFDYYRSRYRPADLISALLNEQIRNLH